jgi:hypothetical protein
LAFTLPSPLQRVGELPQRLGDLVEKLPLGDIEGEPLLVLERLAEEDRPCRSLDRDQQDDRRDGARVERLASSLIHGSDEPPFRSSAS